MTGNGSTNANKNQDKRDAEIYKQTETKRTLELDGEVGLHDASGSSAIRSGNRLHHDSDSGYTSAINSSLQELQRQKGTVETRISFVRLFPVAVFGRGE